MWTRHLLILLYGLRWLPILWPHIPGMALVSDTSNIPQHDVGNHLASALAPCNHEPRKSTVQGLRFWFEGWCGVAGRFPALKHAYLTPRIRDVPPSCRTLCREQHCFWRLPAVGGITLAASGKSRDSPQLEVIESTIYRQVCSMPESQRAATKRDA